MVPFFEKLLIILTDKMGIAGIPVAILIIVNLLFMFYIRNLYSTNMKDKQKQIDRLAEENKEYREKFLNLLDKGINLSKVEKKRG